MRGSQIGRGVGTCKEVCSNAEWRREKFVVPVRRKQSINLDLGRGSMVMAWDSEALVLIAQPSFAFIRKRSAQRLEIPGLGVARQEDNCR